MSPLGSGYTEIWQVLSKAPDDNPPDQPKTTLDRQDVPPTKPGMDAPTSPDATNPEIDRSDYTAPGTNPDVDHNSPEDYKPDSNSADDLKKRGRSGKSKLPGSGGAHASSYNMQHQTLFGSQAVTTTRIAAPHCAGADRVARFHVYATSPNDEDANVGKDDSAGATVCHAFGCMIQTYERTRSAFVRVHCFQMTCHDYLVCVSMCSAVHLHKEDLHFWNATNHEQAQRWLAPSYFLVHRKDPALKCIACSSLLTTHLVFKELGKHKLTFVQA